MPCITMGYTTPPQKYWNYTKINVSEGHEVWTLVGKARKFLDWMGILLIGDGYFYIGRGGGDNSYSVSMTIFGYNPKLSL